MNYTNYERNIVEHYGFALVNWPLSGHIQNPSKVGGRAEVQRLLDALKSQSCEWVKLTDEERVARMKDNRERHARGECVYVARKPRKTAATSQHKSNEIVDSSSDDDTSSDSE